MGAIGFRVTPTEIFYAVLEGDTNLPKIVLYEKIRMPKALDFPAALTWCRNNIIELFAEYKASACGIKMAEPLSRSMGAAAYKGSIIRANMEGILIESANYSGLKVVAGPYSSISSLIESKKPKKYIDADEFRSIEGWDQMNDKYKESILAGVAALGLLEE